MAGQLTIDTLKASSGVLATQNGMTGIAKAWCYYNASTSTIVSSFNISSITRTAQGRYTYTFTTSFPNANFVVATSSASKLVNANEDSFLYGVNPNIPPTSSTVSLWTKAWGSSQAPYDPDYTYVTVFSA